MRGLPNLGRNPYRYMSGVLAALILAGYISYGYIVNNLVWLTVSWHTLGIESPIDVAVQKGLVWQLAKVAKSNPRTSLGLGVLAALRSDEATALSLWQQGKDSSMLVNFG